jgi:hypothetical protein
MMRILWWAVQALWLRHVWRPLRFEHDVKLAAHPDAQQRVSACLWMSKSRDLGRYLSLDNERPLDLLIWRLMGDNWTQHRIKQNQQLRQIARQLRRTR